MKSEARFEQSQLTLLLNHYRNYTVPFLMILGSVFLIWFVILPQIQELQEIKKQEEAVRKRSEILQKNVTFLKDIKNLDENLALAMQAFPSEKDYVGLLLSIPGVAAASKVGVDDYAFTVGALSSSVSAKSNTPGAAASESSGNASGDTNLDLSISGPMDAEKAFLEALLKTFPIASATEVEFSNQDAAQVKTTFFASLLPQAKFDPEQELTPLSKQDEQVLEEIKIWKKPIENVRVIPASPSATTAPQPSPSRSVSPSPTPRLSVTPTR